PHVQGLEVTIIPVNSGGRAERLRKTALAPKGETAHSTQHGAITRPCALIHCPVHRLQRTTGLDVIDELRQKLEDLLGNLVQQGKQLLEQTIERVNLYLEEFKQNLGTKVDHLSECTALVPQKLDQISARCLEKAQICHTKFVAQVNVVYENAKEQTDVLVGKVGELKKLAETCLADNSLFDNVKCLVRHMDDAVAVVSEVLSDTGKLLTDTVKETFALTAEVSGCLVDVVRLSHDATDKLAEEISNCLREEKALHDY
ncbi:uncharacterized protein LOC129774375, partial [Toxorhynchites rutilus septentrionalis]|uniref:uncharacterized protein LOC129774375 n=1 Tax=Toxorhynchites rutilus septentrionalis TaxID=329112 RepID=UPI0024797EF7